MSHTDLYEAVLFIRTLSDYVLHNWQMIAPLFLCVALMALIMRHGIKAVFDGFAVSMAAILVTTVIDAIVWAFLIRGPFWTVERLTGSDLSFIEVWVTGIVIGIVTLLFLGIVVFTVFVSAVEGELNEDGDWEPAMPSLPA